MRLLAIVLKCFAPVFVLVALLHLALGLGAEVLLGAVVPADVLAEPSLDSQNRFYGMASLNDPKGLLEGPGKGMRHIKIVDGVGDIDAPAILQLVHQAFKLP